VLTFLEIRRNMEIPTRVGKNLDKEDQMNDTDVLIVGAGPTGLTLATSLLLKGVGVALVDRQSEGANTSRAAGVNARTLEVLEGLDVTRRLVKEGIEAPRFAIRDGAKALLSIDFSGLQTAYPFTLLVPQSTTERLLLERVRELGGDVIRPKVLDTVVQDATGATATFADGDTIRARYVVGADGMHSTVREQAHVHSPAGGQGMNLGIQDAVVLADALAAVLDGGSDSVLDHYSATRRPIAQQVVELTDRLTKLATLPRALRPVRNAMLGIIGRIPPATRALASRLSGLVYR
jgi:2-polyprenyl-6-methoxyphenol hydroxylase-like FAD-dependent oxidoreductase